MTQKASEGGYIEMKALPNLVGGAEDGLNYEEKRLTLKFNSWDSGVLIIQSTVGVTLFALQEALLQVGLVWGGFLALTGCYLTTYGLYLLSETAGKLEEEMKLKTRIKNCEELASYIDFKFVEFSKWAMLFCGICIMIASNVANIFLLGRPA